MAFRTNGCLMCHIISQPHLAEADQSLESCPKVSRDSWWRRISAWSLGVQAPTTDTRSNYQSISLKSYRKNQVIYQILQVHHIYKHIFQYDVITPGRWHHQRFSAASPRRMMSGFTYRPVVPAVCGRLGTGGRSSGLGGFLHHDIEKLHFHDLPGKTKKMLVICHMSHMYIQ